MQQCRYPPAPNQEVNFSEAVKSVVELVSGWVIRNARPHHRASEWRKNIFP